MKMFIAFILAIAMAFSMAACVKSETPNTTEPNLPKPTTPSLTKPTEGTEPTQNKEEKYEEFKIPRLMVYCKVPESCDNRETNGVVALTTNSKAYLATVLGGDRGSFSVQLEEMLATYTELYKRDANKYFAPDIADSEMRADTTERVTISGYEAVKFSGSVENTENWSYKIYGYSMIIDDVPVIFLGVLRSEDQSEADFQAMMDLVDQMANSIYK